MWSTSATAASTSSSAVAPTPISRGVVGAELGHRPVVRPGRAGGDLGVEAGVEHHAGAERGEHELALEAELVERQAALVGVERAERLVALGAGEQPVAEGHLLVDLAPSWRRVVAVAGRGARSACRRWRS